MKEHPPEFDPRWYVTYNRDLAWMSTDEAVRHWSECGRGEGRQPSFAASRHGLASLIEPSDQVLEIGPFVAPICRGPNVRYFDVLAQDELEQRAKSFGMDVSKSVPIDYVSPRGDLSAVEAGRFDIVLSSHCIEHQPDLIAHLQQIKRILRPGGHYLLIIPDKRYCFDHFIAETTIADVLSARGQLTHTLGSVIEHRALTTHNDAESHWRGDHGSPNLFEGVRVALAEFEAANGDYIDVHAWQFTPESFRGLIQSLYALGFIKLKAAAVYATIKNTFEFTAVLRVP